MGRIDLDELFTIQGAVTVEKRHQFAGREELIGKCLDALAVPDSTLVLFGERGVGKTSLGWQLFASLSGDTSIIKERSIKLRRRLEETKFCCVWCKCNDRMTNTAGFAYYLVVDTEVYSLRHTFPDLFVDTKTPLDHVKSPSKVASASVKARVEGERGSSTGVAPSEELASFIVLKELFQRVRQSKLYKGPLILFLDEFDQVGERAGIGSLMKSLNDIRFVIIGVAESRSALIGQHPSLKRKMAAHEVPLFTAQNVNWFLDSVEQRSKNRIRFTLPYRSLIFEKSSGFPWLLQQLAYHNVLNTVPDGFLDNPGSESVVIDVADYRATIGTFLEEKLGKDQFELSSLSEVGKRVLTALSKSAKGRLAENDLVEGLPDELRAFYERAIDELRQQADLIAETGHEVRLKDPLTKILIDLAVEEGLIQFARR